MKKKLLLIFVLLLTTTGCLKRDKMDNITINTTAYPIYYLVDNIYGYNSTINRIYPVGVDISTHEFTEKQIKSLAQADMFIYNGRSKEKKLAVSFLNHNKNIKLIDAPKNYFKKIWKDEEMWLSPSNFLTLAQNIKDELIKYANTTIVKKEIEANYEKIKIIISKLEADLKSVADNSDNKTIITEDETFNFLNKFGFKVIPIYNEGKIVSKNYQQARDKITNKENSYIYVLENYDEKNEDINALVKKGAKIIKVRTMNNLSEEELKEAIDYPKLLTNFIEQLKEEVNN